MTKKEGMPILTHPHLKSLLLKIKPFASKSLKTIMNIQEETYRCVKTSWHEVCRRPIAILVYILCSYTYTHIITIIGLVFFKTI